MTLEGVAAYTKIDAEKYSRRRWWAGLTFGDMLDKAADVYPEKTAVVDDDGHFTYADLRCRVDRLAIGLADLGIRATDRVLLQLPNWRAFVEAYFALQKIGAIPVVLIARYRQYEINHLAQASGATAWIVAESFRRTEYLPIIADVLRDSPGIRRVIVCRSATDHAYTRYEALIEKTVMDAAARDRLAALRPDPMQIAHMGPTGGTTGVPKIAPHTHNNYLCKVEYSARASEFNQQTTCLVVLPAAHDLPFANGICATLFAGGKLVLSDATDPETIYRIIARERVNTVVWVPTLTYRMVNSDAGARFDISSLDTVYCGGGVSSPELIRAAIKKYNCTYICGYGGTEGMLTSTRKHDDMDTLCRSIGKPTCPYDHYKVVDDGGRALPAGQTGHLQVKGPSMFTGYYHMAEENAEVFSDDGYFRTGDLAAIDEKGYIRLAGRVKDTIKRGGESIFATEIENLIIDHPDVAAVAVIGVPDREMGERVCAVIQPKTGAALSFDAIIGYLKARKTSVLQLPEFIEFVDEMPLTPTGKVNKHAVKADIVQKRLSAAGAAVGFPEHGIAPQR